MIGARRGRPNWFRNLAARALADDLTVFVVPDARLARAAGLDLAAAGLRPVPTPRHASVLLLVGQIPEGLAPATGVAYAQMPRPRTILAAGSSTVAGVPEPDVAVGLQQSALRAGVADLRRTIAAGAFAPAAAPLDLAATQTRREYVCPMHPEIVRDAPGSCPICGMDLVPREAAAAHAHDHAGMAVRSTAPPEAATAEPTYTCPMHPEVEATEPGTCPVCGMRLVPKGGAERSGCHGAAADAAPAEETARYACPMHPEVVADHPGNCPICGMTLQPRAPGAAPEPEPEDRPGAPPGSTYTCPMHPQIVRSEPGRCPICGMHLVPQTPGAAAPDDHAGHAPHAGHAGHAPEPAVSPGEHAGANPPHHAHHALSEEDDDTVAAAEVSHAMHGGHQADDASPQRDTRVAMSHSATDHAAMGDGGAEHAAAGVAASDRAPAIHPAMDHGSQDHAAMGHATMDHAAMGHQQEDGAEMDHAAIGHEANDRQAMGSQPMDHAAKDHGAMDHGAMDHAAMGHDMGGGFMSMVAMTKDLPRSRDGLPMEWIDAAFGPLFPGLPGGLALTFTLDGDAVAAATVEPGLLRRGLEAAWDGPVATFPEHLARLDPLSPAAYRLLAWRTIEAAAGVVAPVPVQHSRVRRAEWERVRSHLGWLAEFGDLIGDRALAQRAADLQLDFARADDGSALARLAPPARAFVRGVRDQPLVRSRLAGVGALTGCDLPRTGPVARAGGAAVDARLDDPTYLALGFTPATAVGDDALARLLVRLAEVAASLDLLEALTAPPAADGAALPPDVSGSGEAAVETPRGTARLHLVAERGAVVAAHLETPTDVNVALVSAATLETEVGDALVAVASLDLSPWERDR